jgi:hypothetical protein
MTTLESAAFWVFQHDDNVQSFCVHSQSADFWEFLTRDQQKAHKDTWVDPDAEL